jgi:hypothetical protein
MVLRGDTSVGAEHKGPLAAFVVIAVIAAVLLVTSVRSQAAPGWLDLGRIPASVVAAPMLSLAAGAPEESSTDEPVVGRADSGSRHQVLPVHSVHVVQSTTQSVTHTATHTTTPTTTPTATPTGTALKPHHEPAHLTHPKAAPASASRDHGRHLGWSHGRGHGHGQSHARGHGHEAGQGHGEGHGKGHGHH